MLAPVCKPYTQFGRTDQDSCFGIDFGIVAPAIGPHVEVVVWKFLAQL